MAIKTIETQGLTVPLPGFGGMGMSAFYGARDDETSKEVLREAIKLGMTFWDTADMYGMGHNEKLLGEVLAEGDNRSKVILCTKFGNSFDGGKMTGVRGDKEYVRNALEASIERLGTIPDVHYQHRVDPKVPIEETISAMEELRKEGKFKYIGMSEPSPQTLKRAARVAKISFLQMEYSPWTTDIETDGILETCRELGIQIVAYSPLGRGFLTGQIKSPSDLSPEDWRLTNPRFSPENFPKNLKIVEELKAIADKKGCTPSQLTLAWVIAQGFIPIPGTKKLNYLQENFGANEVDLTEEDIKAIRLVVDSAKLSTAGNRYTEAGMNAVYH